MREYHVQYETPDGRIVYEMFAADTVTEVAVALNAIDGKIINITYMGGLQ